jgi:hypothetical protein
MADDGHTRESVAPSVSEVVAQIARLMKMEDKTMTPPQAAIVLGVRRETIYRYLRRKTRPEEDVPNLEVIMMGGRKRISVRSILAFLRARYEVSGRFDIFAEAEKLCEQSGRSGGSGPVPRDHGR